MSKTLYTFNEITDIALFDTFVRSNGGTVFQTAAWAKVKTAWKPRMFMCFKDDYPILSLLCLERSIRFLGKLWYGAEGFVGDMTNEGAVREFTQYLKKQMKEYGVFGTVIDPACPVKYNSTEVTDGRIKILTDAGFTLTKDKSCYAVQPATDVVIPVWDKTEEDLISACEKGVRHGYRTGLENGLYADRFSGREIKQNPIALDIFFKVMTETADRVEFVHRTKDYYANILEALGNDAELMLVWYDRDKAYQRYETSKAKADEMNQELDSLDMTQKGAKQRAALLKKEISALEKYIQTYKKADAELTSQGAPSGKICLAGGLTSYFGKESVCLYGGTVNLLRNTLRPTHFLNVCRLIESAGRGCAFHSMGRITGDPYDETNPLYGLVNYKKSYGGDVIEYVGDLTLKNGTGLKMYAFNSLFPRIRHFRSTVMRRFLNRKQSSSNN